MKYLIIGAGPAGLTLANYLRQHGEDSFLLLEANETAGGLCRSVDVDGSPLDIGGGHFLDVRNPQVNDFLFRFMPEEEWNQFDRDSRISIQGKMISHPIEANIWQMDIDTQIEYLKSIAAAGCNNGEEMPETFVEWIFWKLGGKISEDYMIPYNQKMFGKNLNSLGTYWLDKLPDVSFEDTLRSCLTRHAYAKQPGHARFYYPRKYGYGELWLRMADAIKSNVEYGKGVKSIDVNTHNVITNDENVYHAEYIINTAPWNSFKEIVGVPEWIRASIKKLKHTAIRIEYFPDNINTEAQWIYYPDSSVSYHRILVRSNFCSNSRGYWMETNNEWPSKNYKKGIFEYINDFAYPLNTVDKPQIMRDLLGYMAEHKIVGLGRWGEHKHYNSDITVELAINKASELIS